MKYSVRFLIHLRGRESLVLIQELTSHMSAVRTRLGQSQEPRTQTKPLTWTAGTQAQQPSATQRMHTGQKAAARG